MSEIEELRIRIAELEARLNALSASDGEEGHGAGTPLASECAGFTSAAEMDHEVVWDPTSKKWAVRYSTGAFTYGGKTTDPEGLTDGLVPVADGSTVSIYGHAVMTLGDDGTVEEVTALTYDTDPTGVESDSPDTDDSSSESEIYYDFLVATIEDDIVYQNVVGALHVGGSASPTRGDEISIGTVTDEEAEDPSALQIFNFDNTESDGSQGLVQRLEIVKEGEDSYKLQAKANGSTVHLIARVDGKIKYIPITGEEERDPDEKDPEDSGSDNCEHPEGAEGVPADEDDGAVAGGNEGGVEAEDGMTHAGDGCNSEDCK